MGQKYEKRLLKRQFMYSIVNAKKVETLYDAHFVSERSLKKFFIKDKRCASIYNGFQKNIRIGTVMNIAFGGPFVIRNCTLVSKNARRYFTKSDYIRLNANNQRFWVFSVPDKTGEFLIVVRYSCLCDAKYFSIQ
jgi:hypothetical protein